MPFTKNPLTVVAPHAIAMAQVGIMESMRTAQPVDELTNTPSDKT